MLTSQKNLRFVFTEETKTARGWCNVSLLRLSPAGQLTVAAASFSLPQGTRKIPFSCCLSENLHPDSERMISVIITRTCCVRSVIRGVNRPITKPPSPSEPPAPLTYKLNSKQLRTHTLPSGRARA